MSAVLIALAIAALLVGFLGCIVPVLPGPPISFVAVLLVWGAQGWDAETFGAATVVVLAAATIIVTILDFVVPIWGAKKYGASSAGIWMSVLGMLLGIFFFPPFGMVLGAFFGALAGEYMAGKGDGDAWRAAWGVFVGTMLGVFLKLVVSGVITFYTVRELFA